MLLEFCAQNELRLNPEDLPAIGSSPSAASQPAQPERLRLCYISNPNSIHTQRWVGWFAKRGHSVCLLADVPPKEPWADVPVIDLSRYFHAPIIRFPVWAAWLRRFIGQWHPDVLHAHRVNSAGWLAAASGFHPYVITPWGSDVFIGPQRSWVARQLARYTLQHADKITTVSQAISDRVIELGAKDERLARVYIGVDLEIFTPRPATSQERMDFRHRLSLSPTAPLVYSPRAINPIYNQDIILQAIPGVLERLPEACFVFTAYNIDPAYKQELDRLVEELHLGEAVRWLPAASRPLAMAERYRSSDVVVSVASSDGAPVSVIEAMACGKPVVCSDLTALREFVTPGETGWLVPVRQVEPLAGAILQALENTQMAAEYGRRAQQFVADTASLDAQMQRMEVIYYQLARVRRS
jgi:glycosyltransferase involved in cell wall biosynthesis